MKNPRVNFGQDKFLIRIFYFTRRYRKMVRIIKVSYFTIIILVAFISGNLYGGEPVTFLVASPDGKNLIIQRQFSNKEKYGNLYIFSLPLLKSKLVHKTEGADALCWWSHDSQKFFFLCGEDRTNLFTHNLKDNISKKVTTIDVTGVLGYSILNPKWCPSNFSTLSFIFVELATLRRAIGYLHLPSFKNIPFCSPRIIYKEQYKGEFTSFYGWTWSPDGTSLYISRNGNEPGLYRLTLDKRKRVIKEEKIISNQQYYYFHFSHDGKKLALINYDETSTLEILYLKSRKIRKVSEEVFQAQWSSDDKTLFFNLIPKTKTSPSLLLSYDLRKRKSKKLTWVKPGVAKWSYLKNQDKIAYLSDNETIWLINSDGTNPHQIFPRP